MRRFAPADDLRGDSSGHAVVRHIAEHDGVGADHTIVPDPDWAEHLGPRAEHHVAPDARMPVRPIGIDPLGAAVAERHAVEDAAVSFDLRVAADDHAKAMDDHNPRPKPALWRNIHRESVL